MKDCDDKLTNALNEVAGEEITVPDGLRRKTINLIQSTETQPSKVFPYAVAMVFMINILISVIFGGILFLIRPITIFEWIIIGSVYSTVNVFLYVVTFINYGKIQDMLHAYSNGGKLK